MLNTPHRIEWVDGEKWPKSKPDPSYPAGIDLDASAGAKRTCTVALPYPAKRIGYYTIRCSVCGATAACTTAGRPDDPRSLKIACQSLQDAAIQ